MAEKFPVTTLAGLREIISDLSPSKTPLLIEGDPGVGKTSVCHDIAFSCGGEMCEVRVALHGAEDFKFPIVDVVNKTLDWIQSMFPTDPNWKGIVLIDELGQAQKAVQAALLGLMHWGERRLGDYTLPVGAHVIATTNRMSNKAGCHSLISPLVSRVCTVDFQPDTSRSMTSKTFNDEFCAYLSAKNDRPAASDVTAIVRAFPELLLDFDAERVDDSPTPRAWDMLASVWGPQIRSTDRIIADGIVGPSASAKACAMRELSVKIDPLAIIKNPKGSTVPDGQPSLLWATVGSVSRYAKNADAGELDAIVTYLNRCPAEYAVYGMLDAMALNRSVMMAPASGVFIKNFGPLIANKS